MLLAKGTALSDDVDLEAPVAANPNPNEAAPAANLIAMNPVTGTFADPSHERAFGAQLFRMAYTFHALFMTILFAAYIWIALNLPPGLQLALAGGCALLVALGLVGRALLHRMADSVGGQRVGSWTWTVTIISDCVLNIGGFIFAPDAECETALGLSRGGLYPLMVLAVVLTNGSHGLGFAHKFALALPVVAVNVLKFTACDDERATAAAALSEFLTLVAGFMAAHTAELYLRHLYAEEEDKGRLEKEKLGLEERNEQLQAEKERLLYDVQRRGHPIDDDNRSAIRRGLQAGLSHSYPSTVGPAPSDSLPPSLPPGPPSSNSSGSVAPPLGSARSCSVPEFRPPTLADLDGEAPWARYCAQYYPVRAAESAPEQGMPPGAPSRAATAGAPSSSFGQSTVPPPSWAELAYRRIYAERAAQSSTDPGLPPPMGHPPTWVELGAEPRALSSCHCRPAPCHCRQWHEERARVVALAASNALGAEVTSGQEVVEELLAEVATQEEEAASAGTVCIGPPGFVTAQRPSSPIL